MSGETEDLLTDAARTLDEEILRLNEARLVLVAKIGEDQAGLLEELVNQRLARDEQIEVRSTLGYWERKLLWIWVRQARLQALRREIGRSAMKYT